MTPEIAAENLTLRYGETVALDGLTLSLRGAGIHGLLGRNGSGKTSLLSLIAGFRKPSAGEIRVGGEPVFENAAVMREICLIRESGDTLDGTERIRAALDFAASMRPHWDSDYAKSLLERFKLSDTRKIGALSRGQRAALACTLGLAARAPVTLFDEAYLGMDAPSRYAFYDALLADFSEHPRLILLSTHLIEEVARLFEQVVIIDAGRVLFHEEADALRAHGLTVTGPAEAVDRFTQGLEVLSEKTLGPTRSVALHRVPEARARAAAEAGLETGPLPLQDLFVHLTASSRKD